MQIEFTRTAMKDLRKVPSKDRTALIEKLENFAKTGEGDVKKLAGQDAYRLRHGVWRAIFEIADNVIVIRVAHRSRVYR